MVFGKKVIFIVSIKNNIKNVGIIILLVFFIFFVLVKSVSRVKIIIVIC